MSCFWHVLFSACPVFAMWHRWPSGFQFAQEAGELATCWKGKVSVKLELGNWNPVGTGFRQMIVKLTPRPSAKNQDAALPSQGGEKNQATANPCHACHILHCL